MAGGEKEKGFHFSEICHHCLDKTFSQNLPCSPVRNSMGREHEFCRYNRYQDGQSVHSFSSFKQTDF